MAEVLDIPGDVFPTAREAQWWQRFIQARVEGLTYHENLAVEASKMKKKAG